MGEISKNNTKIKIADWLVTEECMLYCSFCFRPSAKSSIDPEKDKIIIKELKESTIEGISLSGGEPLIREDVGSIAKTLYRAGKRLVLFTNAMLWEERIKDIQPYLSYIRIPLDGSNQEITKKHRSSPEQFNKVMGFLGYSRNDFKPTVYVGTVLTKLNKEDIANIGHIIEKYSQVKKWSISQLTLRGIGLDSSIELSVSDSEFQDITSKVIEMFPHVQIVAVDGRKRDGACILILPNLQVVTPYGNGYATIGNLSENSLNTILSSPLLDPQKTSQRENCYRDK